MKSLKIWSYCREEHPQNQSYRHTVYSHTVVRLWIKFKQYKYITLRTFNIGSNILMSYNTLIEKKKKNSDRFYPNPLFRLRSCSTSNIKRDQTSIQEEKSKRKKLEWSKNQRGRWVGSFLSHWQLGKFSNVCCIAEGKPTSTV